MGINAALGTHGRHHRPKGAGNGLLSGRSHWTTARQIKIKGLRLTRAIESASNKRRQPRPNDEAKNKLFLLLVVVVSQRRLLVGSLDFRRPDWIAALQ